MQNIVILVGKHYVNKNRIEYQKICLNQFLCVLKRKLESFVNIYSSEIVVNSSNYELQIGNEKYFKKILSGI